MVVTSLECAFFLLLNTEKTCACLNIHLSTIISLSSFESLCTFSISKPLTFPWQHPHLLQNYFIIKISRTSSFFLDWSTFFSFFSSFCESLKCDTKFVYPMQRIRRHQFCGDYSMQGDTENHPPPTGRRTPLLMWIPSHRPFRLLFFFWLILWGKLHLHSPCHPRSGKHHSQTENSCYVCISFVKAEQQ